MKFYNGLRVTNMKISAFCENYLSRTDLLIFRLQTEFLHALFFPFTFAYCMKLWGGGRGCLSIISKIKQEILFPRLEFQGSQL